MLPAKKTTRRVKRATRRRFAILAVLIALAVVATRYETTSPLRSVVVTDVEALARVIRSEIGGGTRERRLHVAWATRNLAREKDKSIVAMACSPCGRQGRGRPVSTRQPARDDDRRLARLVLSSPGFLDPTGGATHFINPRLQDQLAENGRVRGYRGQTYRRVRRRWQQSYNWDPYYRLGPTLEFWGPRRERTGVWDPADLPWLP